MTSGLQAFCAVVIILEIASGCGRAQFSGDSQPPKRRPKPQAPQSASTPVSADADIAQASGDKTVDLDAPLPFGCRVSVTPSTLSAPQQVSVSLEMDGAVTHAMLDGHDMMPLPHQFHELVLANKTYKADITDASGKKASCQADVAFTPPPVAPMPGQLLSCSLAASATPVSAGTDVKLELKATGDVKVVMIEDTVIDAAPFEKSVRAASSKTYSAQVIDAAGSSATCSTLVTVSEETPSPNPPPTSPKDTPKPTCTLTPTLLSGSENPNVRLLLGATGDISTATIDGSAAAVSNLAVDRFVAPGSSKNFSASVTDTKGRSATCNANFAAPPPPEPLACTLTAVPAIISSATPVKLTLSMSGPVTSANIGTNNLMPAPHEMSDLVTQTTTYTAVVKDSTGASQSCSTKVDVINTTPPTCSLTVEQLGADKNPNIRLALAATGNYATAEIDGTPVANDNMTVTRQVAPGTTAIFSAQVQGDNGKGACTVAATVEALQQTAKHVLNIVSTTSTVPIDILFVIDDSFSMADNIAKLKDSLSVLVDRLKAAGVQYKGHVLLMSQVLSATATGVRRDSSALLYETVRPALAEDSGFDGSVVPISKASYGSRPKYTAMATFTNSDSVATVKAKISAIQVQKMNNEPGVCAAMRYLDDAKSALLSLTRTHVIVLSDEDNGVVTEDVQSFSDSVIATNKLHCFDYTLTTSVCTKKRKYSTYYTWTDYCTDYSYNNYRYEYDSVTKGSCQQKSASAPDTESIYQIVSREGCATELYKCKQPYEYKDTHCQDPDTGADVTFSYSSSPMFYAKKYASETCKAMIDGTAYDAQVNCGTQPNLVCKVNTASAFKGAIYGSCATDKCVASCGACANRSTTRFNEAYILKSDYDNGKSKANPSYTDCSLHASNYSPSLSLAVKMQYNGGNLTSLQTQACPQFYGPYAFNYDATLISNICEHELSGWTLPSGYTAVKTGTSTTQKVPVQTSKPYSPFSTLPAGYREAGVDGPIRVANQCFTYQTIGVNDERRKLPSFQQTIVEHKNVIEGTPGIPRTGAVATTVYEESGLHETCEKWEAATVRETYYSDPDGFVKYLKDKQPGRELVWHTIASLDANACSTASGDASIGTDYKMLSKLTGGATASVCEPNFNEFMTAVSKTVVKNTTLEYSLPTAILPAKIRSVKNLRTAATLRGTTDYTATGGKIIFVDAAVLPGDQVEIEYDR